MNTFRGCDEGLLEGARSLFLVTYAMIGLSVCPLIALCCVAASAIASAIEEDERASGTAGVRMPNAAMQVLSRARAAMV